MSNPLTSTLATAEQSFLTSPLPFNKKWKTADDGSSPYSWATGLSYDEMRHGIGAAFAGSETVPGEPSLEWMVSQVPFESQQEKIDLVTLFMSFYVDEKMKGSKKHESLAFAMRTNDKKNATSPPFAGLLVRGQMPALATDRSKKSLIAPIEPASSAYMTSLDQWHAEYGPQQPHWHITTVGTHPSQQGQGIGGALMTRVAQLADEAHMDCYLECGSEKNRSFYERFGYKVVYTKSVQDNTVSKDVLSAFGMTRPAGASKDNSS